jgi:RNase P subunit RPR2
MWASRPKIQGWDLMDEFEQLKALVETAETEVNKAAGGNRAASVRARKTMSDIKKIAQDIRVKLLETRDAG